MLISCSNHCCGHCEIAHCSGNYSTEPHNCAFDLLFIHLKCEYTLWSVNESLCCSTGVPYLDITVLIRWIKLISKSEHRRQCCVERRHGHGVSLMIRLPSAQRDCCFAVISPSASSADLCHHVISVALILISVLLHLMLGHNESIHYLFFLFRGEKKTLYSERVLSRAPAFHYENTSSHNMCTFNGFSCLCRTFFGTET